ncbi:HIT family protein [Nanoarchaeota archaeon]
MKCFFCGIQKEDDNNFITSNHHFFARYDDFPISPGHCEIAPFNHIDSLFDLDDVQLLNLYYLIFNVRAIIQQRYKPDGFNIGINEGKAAGRTQDHLHIHLIPRYHGDTPNPTGGVRNIIPDKADYLLKVKHHPLRKKYYKKPRS